MERSQVAKRYARALFASAQEAGVLDAVQADLAALANLADSSDEFAGFLSNPLVPLDKQQQVVEKMAEGSNALSVKFFRFLAVKDRLDAFPAIAAAFADLCRDHQGILPVVVTAAVDLSDAQVTALKEKLAARFDKTIDLTVTVDASLVGGFRYQVGDEIHDYSLASRLADFKRKVMNA